MCTRATEGMYLLSLGGEKPVLAQGFHSSDHAGLFGYGLNNFDGGEFILEDDLPEDTHAVLVFPMTEEYLDGMRRNMTENAVEWALAYIKAYISEYGSIDEIDLNSFKKRGVEDNAVIGREHLQEELPPCTISTMTSEPRINSVMR